MNIHKKILNYKWSAIILPICIDIIFWIFASIKNIIFSGQSSYQLIWFFVIKLSLIFLLIYSIYVGYKQLSIKTIDSKVAKIWILIWIILLSLQLYFILNHWIFTSKY